MNYVYTVYAILLVILPLISTAQAILSVSNPSHCRLQYTLDDNTCPEDGPARPPNRIAVQVRNTPGTQLGKDVYLQEVRLILAHTWISDIHVSLQSPSGQVVTLFGNVGGGDDHIGDPTDTLCQRYARLTPASCANITDGRPPYIDRPYRPQENFADFYDGSNPNGDWLLSICDDLPNDRGILQYIELVFAPLTCLPVVELLVDHVDTTTAVLTYDSSQACGPAIVEIGPPGFTPGAGSQAGEGQIFTVDCPPFALMDLEAGMAYEAYIRRYCPDNNTFSANSCPVSFRTGCRLLPTTQLSTFDTEQACSTNCGDSCPLEGFWHNSSNDAFDFLVHSGPTPTGAGTGPTDDITGGGNYLYIENNGIDCSAGGTAILQSGCFELDKQGTDSCHFSFSYHMYGIHTASLRLQVSADGGQTWATIWQRSGNQGDRWQKAYTSLRLFNDGAVLQLRFVAARGTGPYGDIAIDQLRLHGSHPLEAEASRFYPDKDNDGYGAAGPVLISCRTLPPPGYADNDADCNDDNAQVNPAATEVPCNGIDDNCNSGQGLDDEALPLAVAYSDTICAGATARLCADAVDPYFIFWYDEPEGGDPIGLGTCFEPILPPHESSDTLVYRFYAELNNTSCASPRRTEVQLLVLPRPAGQLLQLPVVCRGEAYDLRSLNLVDTNFTQSQLSFYANLPLSPENRLEPVLSTVTDEQEIFYLYTSPAGCADTGSFRIPVSGPGKIRFSPAADFSLCRGGQQEVTALPEGTDGPYRYQWNTGATTPTVMLSATASRGERAVYTVTVTSPGGCSISDSVQVLTTNAIDSARVTARPVSSCNGQDGSITLIPLNGIAPYSLQWSNATGQSGSQSSFTDTFRLSGLRQGDYRFTITDASSEGCEIRLRNIRVQGPGFQINGVNSLSPSCVGAADGSLCVQASPATGLQYQWSNGATGRCAEGLRAGTYQVTITNGKCVTVETYLLEDPLPLGGSAELTSPSCADGADGSIRYVASGGTAPYQYQWSNNRSGSFQRDLRGGSYRLTVTDARGCRFETQLQLSAPDSLRLLPERLQAVSCAGLQDGSLRILATGGKPPYRYRWANGDTLPQISGLAPGSYSLTVTDAAGCSRAQSYLIKQPQPLLLQVVDLLEPRCASGATGGVDLLASGGTPPYRYAWPDGLTAEASRRNLPPGQYRVQVFDARDCPGPEVLIELTAQTAVSLTAELQQPACVGQSSGIIRLQPAGGQGQYTYQWADGSTLRQREGLTPGKYAVTVQDAQGCQAEASFELTAPQVFDFMSVVSPPSCAGAQDGIIDQIMLRGGTAPFSYRWNDGARQEDRSGLGSGQYAFTVTDAAGCSFSSDTFSLQAPPRLQLLTTDRSDPVCNGEASGFIISQAIGGSPPYQYNWLGQGISSGEAYNLKAGQYRLLVTDRKGCTIDTTYTLREPILLAALIDLKQTDICKPGGGDTLLARASGGSGGYSFRWSDNSTGSRLNNPPPGNYRLEVTDSRGCTEQSATVKVRERQQALELEAFVVDPVSCFGSKDASMTARIRGGTGNYAYYFTPNFVDFTTADSVRHAGLAHSSVYSVTVTDLGTGCTVRSALERPRQPAPLVASIADQKGLRCYGDRNAQIDVIVSGGTPAYSYLWRDSLGREVSRQQNLYGAGAGLYQFSVQDARGCGDTLSDIRIRAISDSLRLLSGSPLVKSIACRGDRTGAISLQVAGGAPPYRYSWSNGATSPSLDSLAAGAYQLTVTDRDTCKLVLPPIQVIQPATALQFSSVVRSLSCHDSQDGFIQLSITGGGAPYDIEWKRNGNLLSQATTSALFNLRAGNYSVAIRDTNQCERNGVFNLVAPPALQGLITMPPGKSDSLFVQVAGGTAPYRYLWSTGSQSDRIGGLKPPPVSYSVTVTDRNLCSSRDTFLLTPTFEPTVDAPYLRAYPNPVGEEILTVEWREILPGTGRIQLISVMGAVVYDHPLLLASSGRLSLDLHALPPGWYALLLTDRQGKRYLRRILRD